MCGVFCSLTLEVLRQVVVAIEIVHVLCLVAILAELLCLVVFLICIGIAEFLHWDRLDPLPDMNLHFVGLALIFRDFIEIQICDWLFHL